MAIPLKQCRIPGVYDRVEKQKTFLGLLNNTQVIFLDGANGKLGGTINSAQENSGTITHNFRGIHSSSYNLQPHFRVLLDDLETFV